MAQIDIQVSAQTAAAQAALRSLSQQASQLNTQLSGLGNGMRGLNAANDNAAGGVRRLGESFRGAGGHGSAFGRILEQVRGSAASTTPVVGDLLGNLAGMGGVVAGIAGVAVAIGAVAAAGISAAAQVETWKANLTTVTGSVQKAEETYAALVNFANTTPFDLGQSIEAFKKLRGLGLAATEERLRSFGNTASASGRSLNDMIEAVADAATGEFERLKGFNIKSKKEGDNIKFTFQGVTTTVKNNSKDIVDYLANIGNTKFGSQMNREMDTINGKLANVKDNLFGAFAALGGGTLGTVAKDFFEKLANGINAIKPLFAAVGNVLGAIVGYVGSVLNGFGAIWSAINTGGQGATGIISGLATALNMIASVLTTIGSGIETVFGTVAGYINQASTSVRDYLGLNQELSKGQASWAQIGTAALDMLKEGWASAVPTIKSYASQMWEGVKSGASEAGSFLRDSFSGPIDNIMSMFGDAKGWIQSTFGDLKFTPEGIITGVARTVDLMVGNFRGGIAAIQVIFDGLPGAIYASLSPGFQRIVDTALDMFNALASGVVTIFKGIVSAANAVASSVAGVINSVISIIESFVNGSIGLINKLIAGANKLGAGLSQLENANITRVAAPKGGNAVVGAFGKLGQRAGAAYRAGFGHEAEDFTKTLIGRARRTKVPGAGGGVTPRLDSGTDVSPDSSGSGSGKNKNKGRGGKTDEQRQAEQYTKSLQDMRDAIYKAGLSERDAAAFTALRTAGLKTNLEATDAQTKAVKDLAYQVYDAEKKARDMKQADEELRQGKDKLAVTQNQLLGVTRSGLAGTQGAIDAAKREYAENARKLTQMTLTIERKKELLQLYADERDASIAVAEANQNKYVTDQLRDLEKGQNDLEYSARKRDGQDPREVALLQENREIQYRREQALADLRSNLDENSQDYKDLVQATNEYYDALKEDVKANAEDQKLTEQFGQLSTFFEDLFTKPKETMKSFFGDLLKQLLQTIAYSAIMGKSLGSSFNKLFGGGEGGLTGSLLGGLFGGKGKSGGLGGIFGKLFGGFFANGGNLPKNKFSVVGENGPELVYNKGASAAVAPNRKLNFGGGGGSSFSFGDTNVNLPAGYQGSPEQVGLHVARQNERMIKKLIQQEMRSKR